MYLVKENKKIRKSFKKYFRSGRITREKLQNLVDLLIMGEKLEPRYKDHELKGEYKGIRECHIEYDLLLLYQINNEDQILFLVNIGSHSDLFG